MSIGDIYTVSRFLGLCGSIWITPSPREEGGRCPITPEAPKNKHVHLQILFQAVPVWEEPNNLFLIQYTIFCRILPQSCVCILIVLGLAPGVMLLTCHMRLQCRQVPHESQILPNVQPSSLCYHDTPNPIKRLPSRQQNKWRKKHKSQLCSRLTHSPENTLSPWSSGL